MNLPKHLLCHRPENEWPFVCLLCGKHTQAKSDLSNHLESKIHKNDSRIPKKGTPAWIEMLEKSVNKNSELSATGTIKPKGY